MTSDAVLRVVSLCVVLAGAETLHGIARTVLVIPRTGNYLRFGLAFLIVTPLLVSWVRGAGH